MQHKQLVKTNTSRHKIKNHISFIYCLSFQNEHLILLGFLFCMHDRLTSGIKSSFSDQIDRSHVGAGQSGAEPPPPPLSPPPPLLPHFPPFTLSSLSSLSLNISTSGLWRKASGGLCCYAEFTVEPTWFSPREWFPMARADVINHLFLSQFFKKGLRMCRCGDLSNVLIYLDRDKVQIVPMSLVLKPPVFVSLFTRVSSACQHRWSLLWRSGCCG